MSYAGSSPAAAPSSGACERCGGVGFEFREQDDYSYAVPCVCRQRRRQTAPSVPPRFVEASFDNFAAQTPSLKRAKKLVEEFARHYPAVDGGLFLMGSEGVGKTHLATALLAAVGEKGFPGLYFDFRELLRRLRGSFDREAGLTTGEVLEPIRNAGLVVIDGVGDETPTDWVNDTLALIINHRYNERRVTVATSRFFDGRTLQGAVRRKIGGDPRPASIPLEERIGTSLLSRFYEMCQFVPIEGVDFRVHIKKEAFPR